MLELMGSEYVIEFCLSEIAEENYRVYVTDALKIIAENIAKAFGGTVLNRRYFDTLQVDEEQKNEETSEEIKQRIMEGVNTE